MKIIQYMALEIKGATDQMFCHFGPFLPIYWQLSDVFDIVMFQNSEEKLWIPITELAILIADNTATSRSKSEIPLSDKHKISEMNAACLYASHHSFVYMQHILNMILFLRCWASAGYSLGVLIKEIRQHMYIKFPEIKDHKISYSTIQHLFIIDLKTLKD